MNKSSKHALIITTISILLMITMIVLIILDTDIESKRIVNFIILPLWSFSLIPAYSYAYYWLQTKDFSDGLQIGTKMGIMFGLSTFIIPIFIAPVLMILYYRSLFNSN